MRKKLSREIVIVPPRLFQSLYGYHVQDLAHDEQHLNKFHVKAITQRKAEVISYAEWVIQDRSWLCHHTLQWLPCRRQGLCYLLLVSHLTAHNAACNDISWEAAVIFAHFEPPQSGAQHRLSPNTGTCRPAALRGGASLLLVHCSARSFLFPLIISFQLPWPKTYFLQFSQSFGISHCFTTQI